MAQFDLSRLQALSRIDSSPEEEEKLHSSLSRILEYMEQLNEVDTENVPPCRFVLKEMMNRNLREDKAEDLLPRDKFLANAPDQIGGMIRTPPVIS